VHRALGARRLRVTFTGVGGHSWAAFGVDWAAPPAQKKTAVDAPVAVIECGGQVVYLPDQVPVKVIRRRPRALMVG